jgi:hypothetical protein
MFYRENLNVCFLVRSIVIYSGNAMTQGYARISLKLKPNGSPSFILKTQESYQIRIAYSISIFKGALERACLRSGVVFDFIPPPGFSSTAITISTAGFQKESLSMQEYLSEFRKTLAAARDSSITPVEDSGDKS